MATDANDQHACVIDTEYASVNVNAGLLPFQLVPTDVTTGKALMAGEVLMNHACSYRNQTAGAELSVYIDLAIGNRQMEVVAPTAEYLARVRLLQDLAMDIRKNISTRNLNNCGIMNGHCIVINSEEGMKRSKDNLCINATIEYIKAKELKQAASKNQGNDQGMRDHVQGAVATVWAISGSMESWLNARTVTKYDIELII